MWRCHSPAHGATQFNSGTTRRGRFTPFDDGDGRFIPTLYAAESFAGALSETLFHSVPRTGVGSAPRTMPRGRLAAYCRSLITSRRALRLISLHGAGIGHLPVTEAALIHSPASENSRTATWAAALHRASAQADGLAWRSRQDTDAPALMLFGDRLNRSDLSVDLRHNGESLALSPVYLEVYAAANAAGITITI